MALANCAAAIHNVVLVMHSVCSNVIYSSETATLQCNAAPAVYITANCCCFAVSVIDCSNWRHLLADDKSDCTLWAVKKLPVFFMSLPLPPPNVVW